MHLLIRLAVVSTSLIASAVCHAETPLEIFTEMSAKQRASLSSISNYTQMKSTMGLCTLEHFEKESTESADGRGTVEYMRLLSQSEIAERHSPDNEIASMTPEQLDAVAGQLRLQQPQMDAHFRREIQSVDLPGGIGQMLLNPPPGEPWFSANPSDMLGMYATMFEGAAEGKRQDAKGAAEAEREAQTDALTAIAEGTRVVGRERLGNHDTVVLLAEDLNWTQVESGQEFTLNSLRLWVDDAADVPVKMRMEGEVRDGSETRELRIEREDTEFQTGPGCGDFVQPLRNVMRIAGVLSPAEEAQMAEAQQKLAEFKLQMDAMPPAQKNMIMRQMGSQMEMFEKMASGGGIEIVSLVTAMRCNAGVPAPTAYVNTLPGNAVNKCSGF